jgi:hypothetical protein
MPVTVIRVYASQDAATSVWQELKRQHFSPSEVSVIYPAADGADAAPSIQAAGIGPYRAQRYAEYLRNGGALVLVRPPFGSAEAAEQILDRFDPLPTGVPEIDYDLDRDYEDDATPFSRFFGWKVLLRNSPAPFSESLGWHTLSKPNSPTYPASIPIPLLGGSAAPLSKTLGLPVLTKHGAPVAPTSGVARLSAKPALFSSLLGLKTLLTKHTILGGELLNSPTPLSSALGLPVLIKN